MPIAQAREALELERSGIDRKLNRIVEAISGGVDAMVLKGELLRLESRKKELSRRVDATGPARPLLHPAMAEIYRAEVSALHDALQDEHRGAAAMDTIRSLIDEIVLTPLNGKLRIDLKGDLAGILGLPAKKNEAPRRSRTPRSK